MWKKKKSQLDICQFYCYQRLQSLNRELCSRSTPALASTLATGSFTLVNLCTPLLEAESSSESALTVCCGSKSWSPCLWTVMYDANQGWILFIWGPLLFSLAWSEITFLIVYSLHLSLEYYPLILGELYLTLAVWVLTIKSVHIFQLNDHCKIFRILYIHQ